MKYYNITVKPSLQFQCNRHDKKYIFKELLTILVEELTKKINTFYTN